MLTKRIFALTSALYFVSSQAIAELPSLEGLNISSVGKKPPVSHQITSNPTNILLIVLIVIAGIGLVAYITKNKKPQKQPSNHQDS